MRLMVVIFHVGLLLGAVTAASRDDIVLADFEGQDYDGWTASGGAFGNGPARGTLPNQMAVSGFKGQGLVNSYRGGDGATGRLVSGPFVIERKYINFLVGGGMHPGRTCINLLVNGRVARTATGPNDRPGGSEELDWHSWDVSEWAQREARIEIVDEATGGWGHINVDQIVQSDRRRQAVSDYTRELTLEKKYLTIPVKNGARKRVVTLLADGERVREFEVELAAGELDFWVFLDVSEFKGKAATLRVDKYDPVRGKGFDAIHQADTFPGQEDLYREKLRPQLHFSSQRGWNNDSNGMVYYDGEYHLFYQHNPFGWGWGNMTWGHAVSTDMLHWRELGDALHPDELGTMFSGSAVVDWENTAGFQTGDEAPIVAIYTSAGGTSEWSKGQPFTQSIAFSNDRGRTWTKYKGNPVLEHISGGNRDPKVLWHEASGQWVMALYLDDHVMGFFTSDDLKKWEFQSKIKCFHECPELFELPVDGDAGDTRWVLYGADGAYLIGQFDGKEFRTKEEPIRFQYGNCFYASQTFNDIPVEDGRRIQIAWGRVDMPGMPFNQMMLFPVTLTLHKTGEGIRMFAEPIREIESLHRRQWRGGKPLAAGESLVCGLEGELFHVKAELRPDESGVSGLRVRGIEIVYDAGRRELTCRGNAAPLEAVGGRIRLEVVVDRTSVEVFANDGRVYMPVGVAPDNEERAVEAFAQGAPAEVESLEVYELASVWRD